MTLASSWVVERSRTGELADEQRDQPEDRRDRHDVEDRQDQASGSPRPAAGRLAAPPTSDRPPPAPRDRASEIAPADVRQRERQRKERGDRDGVVQQEAAR